MSDLTATQKASAMYNRAKNIASGKIDLEVSGETVMGIIFLGFIYMIISSIGMNIYSKCDAMKGQPVQENLNKYLAATLTIALTIPFTLLVTKFVKNEGAVFALIYSIMGLVGSAAALNWAVKCENAKSSDKNFAALTTAVYSLTLCFLSICCDPREQFIKLISFRE
jgi:low temperature requirement protein LtrA